MAYYVGKYLDERIKSFGLEDLERHFQAFAAGKIDWVGEAKITPGNHDEIEQFRLVLYSLIHKMGLKPQLQVKVSGDSIIICRKKTPQTPSVVLPQFGADGYAGPTAEDQDMATIFTEGEE